MKKLSKLLAVVLAIAVVICPMVSVVANAEDPANGYKISRVDANTLALEITSTTGFLVYKADVTFEVGSDFDDTYNDDDFVKGLKVDDYSLVSATKDEFNYPTVSSNYGDDVVTFIVNSTDAGTLDLYSSVTVLIHVTTENATATLTGIQAADEGTVETDPTLIPFEGVDPATGEVDQTSEYAQENATPVDAHTHKLEHHSAEASTCQTQGNSEYWSCDCGKYFSDEEGQNEINEDSWILALDANNHEGEPTGDYQKDADGHWQLYSCCSAPATSSNHVFDNACDTTCDTCGYIRTVGEHTFAYYAEGEKTEETHTVKCSECGATQPESHTGGTATCLEKAECEVCGTAYGNLAPHTFTKAVKNGDAATHKLVCSVDGCTAEDTEHTSVTCTDSNSDGACDVCGQGLDILDSSIASFAPSVAIGAQLGVGYKFLDTEVAKYAKVELVVTPTLYDITDNAYAIYQADPVVFDKFESNLGYSFQYYYGVAMYALDLPIDARLDFYNADGEKVAHSNTLTNDPATLVKVFFAQNYPGTGTAKTNKRKVARDLLVMGGEAQRYFQKQVTGTDLNAVTTYVDADDPLYNFTTDYDPETVIGTLNETSVLTEGPNYNSAVEYAPSVTLVAAPSLGYKWNVRKNSTDLYDPEKIRLNVSYTTHYNLPEEGALVEKTFTISDFTSTLVNGGKRIVNIAYFNEVCFYDANKTVTAVLEYDNGSGYAPIATYEYSIEKFCAEHINADPATDKFAPICGAIARFGVSARTFFKTV